MELFRPCIEAVCVDEPAYRNEPHTQTLCDERCAKLNPPDRVAGQEISIRNEFFGDGIPTPESRETAPLFHTFKCVELENTRTGKPVAALLLDLDGGALDGQTVLYLNTLNARALSAAGLREKK